MNAHIIRTETSEQGTFGKMTTDSGLELVTGELPWKDNQQRVSCIPAGTYTCVWHQSPSKGWVYKVLAVPGRDQILIHSGNFCGDEECGYHTDFLGCIGLGYEVGEIGDQKAIEASRKAVEAFENDMNMNTFDLIIEWAPGVGENA